MELPPELAFDWEVAAEDICSALRDYMANVGARRAVVGLSGGVDSSVTAALAARALGAENVHALLLPEKGVTPKADVEDALRVARMLGIEHELIQINSLIEAYTKLLSFLRDDTMSLANLKARVRMTVLYAKANHVGRCVVLGTGDKSELLLGYFTKYGDGGVDLLPIGDLYKTQVRYLAMKLGLPERVWKKEPSPRLIRGKRARDELGAPYEVIDRVLYYRVEARYPEEEVARKLNLAPGLVHRICSRVYASHHKRKPPPICKLGPATINWDWRMPIE
jgi:NAD+ synthase